MDDEGPSYYSVLNVPPDASDGEIRRAYRQLAQVFHPDKHASEELREKAAEGFAVINEAYEVLSSPPKRQVYDIYGKQGLAAGLDVGTKLKSVDELKAQWEKFRARRGSDADGDTETHTILHCDVDLTRMLVSRPLPQDWHPRMQTCWVQTTVSQAIGRKGFVWMGGNIISNGGGEGGGTLLCGFKGNLSSESSVEANACWGVKTSLLLTSTQQITENAFGTITGSWSAEEGPGLQFSTSRNISGETRGSIGIGLGPPSDVGAHLTVSTRPNTKSSLSGKIQVGPIYSISGRGSYALNEDMTARAGGKFGLSGIDFDLGIVKRISPETTMSMAVVVGIQGTVLRVKWNREGFQLDIPLILSRDFKEWKIALAAYTLPPLLISIVRYLVFKPLMRKYEERVALAARKEHSEAIARQLRAATASQSLISPVAQRLTREAAAQGGLVIVHAEYGVIDGQRRPIPPGEQAGASSASSLDLPPSSLDVTAAIQYLVSARELILHPGVSKFGLMGFCDPAPGQKKTLRIRYVWKGRPYRAEVGDEDGLKLPSQGALVLDLAEAEQVMTMAKALGVESGGEPSQPRPNGSPSEQISLAS
ncbi:hypothetical protein BSKO_11965 [Bryopsis sp. KO-2023]|nr:hypothetical protein BSKO_11965 [Bryopsis sp. KO-2023]